ncbi:hypothetical protein [Candidatus Palauibacter sp.]|uniref:hypothetical protein n=1 Tax=Candidatus Palauibacter sp. TaxID=3101350 RepID=UPI003AF2A3F9
MRRSILLLLFVGACGLGPDDELWILEQAWRQAEEIAAIADNLLLPARTDEFFDRHGRRD